MRIRKFLILINHYFNCFITSSAKFSSFFSIPSPTWKRAISNTLLFPKYLATVSFIKSQEITFSLSALNSLIMFSAKLILIGECMIQ